MINIIEKKTIWLSISGALMMVGVVSLMLWGLKPGIDFTGGSLLEVDYTGNRPALDDVRGVFSARDIKDVELKASGDHGIIARFKTVDQPMHEMLLTDLKTKGDLVERSFESIGPVIGAELRDKAWKAVLLAVLIIMLYISFTFRRVSRPVISWKYGVAAILALAHDLITLLGVFAILGHFGGVEINSSFIAAFLTVLGFSVHDTIVVFDRIRENIMKHSGDFAETVNRSLNETIVRSINTSLTVMLVLLSIYLFGGESLQYFALALLIGIGIGTYSSIFVASPLLVLWHEFDVKRAAVAGKMKK